MILSEIWQECGLLLNDPQNQRWTQDILTRRANVIQTEIQGITNAVQTKEVLTPIQSTRTLDVDTDVINIVGATRTKSTGEVVPFEGINRDQLDFKYPNWQQWGDGELKLWFFDASNHQINLIPKPDSANAIVNGLTFWEILKPADMSGSTDVPFDSNSAMIPYHRSIVHGVVALCWMDDATPEALTKSKFHRSGDIDKPGEFENQIKLIQKNFDTPVDVPLNILWKPQGGRIGRCGPTKSYPLG